MEIKAKIFQPQLKAQISTANIRAKLNGGAPGIISLSALSALLNSLPSHKDDDAAVNIGGLALNDLYWVADGSDSNIPGNLRRVTTV